MIIGEVLEAFDLLIQQTGQTGYLLLGMFSLESMLYHSP